MSLESALRIFRERGVKNPERIVDTIRRAISLESLNQIMRDDGTCSNAAQFVHLRLSVLFKGDPAFARRVLEAAQEKYRGLGLPDEMVNYYISDGGGCDTAGALGAMMHMGRMPKVEDTNRLELFSTDADRYLFEALRGYVADS